MSTELEIGTKATVRVPASSANLGPGYDTLGLALGIYDVIEVEVTSSGLEIEIYGEAAGWFTFGGQGSALGAERG